MLGITTTQPVHWPPAASPAIAPVTPVGPVTPAQGTSQGASQDAASGFGSGRQGRAGGAPDTPQDRSGSADKAKTPTGAQAAPLLPRAPAEGQPPGGATTKTDAAQSEEQKREVQPEDKPPQALPLKEVLSNIWKASAAVVDVALGREGGATGSVVAGSDARAGDDTGTISPTARAVDTSGDASQGSVDPQPAADPVTYSDQGLGLWEPAETGVRVNEKA